MKAFTTLKEALLVLYDRTSSATFELREFKQCISDLNNPQLKLKVVHVAGTNGKGSVSNYISTSLETAGFKVGLYTSPFLITHNDRFRINHQPISDEKLLHYINLSIPYWNKYNLTMFEIDTLIAIWYFLDEKVDWAIFEVGLGGRLDATNIVLPEVSVITTIGYDHMDFLGDTLAKITYEKAGIIKHNVPVVTFNKNKEVYDVILDVALQQQAPIVLTKKIQPINQEMFSQTFKYDNHTIELSSGASYQRLNAALAYETLKLIQKKHQKLKDRHILNGLKQATWPGRFDAISKEPLIVVDGAHNIEGIEALVENFKNLLKPVTVVFAALKDKQTKEMLEILDQHADSIIVTEFDFYRAQSAHKLAYKEHYQVITDYELAIKEAINHNENGTVMVCGSLYFISQVYNSVVLKQHKEH